MRIVTPKQRLLAFLLFACIIANGQTGTINALDSFSGAFLRNIRAAEGQKAYLVTNKSIYTAGEALWFRTFLLRDISERLSIQSKSLFVDLVNDHDAVIRRLILNAHDQQTGGKLPLPDTLSTGNYWLRAYTAGMAEKDPAKAAVTAVYVVNPASPANNALHEKRAAVAGEQPVTVEILPEGGSMVTGVNTTLGFYVHDASGHPLALTGNIKDNRDSVVGSFTSSAYGLAKTVIFPYFYRKYRAVVNYENKEYSFPLPPFNAFAGQLSAAVEGGGALKLRTVLEDSLYRKDALTYIIGISKDSLCFAGIGEGSYETDVPLSRFPAGIATFILFNKDFRVLSARSVYVPTGQLHVSAMLDQNEPAKHARLVLNTTITGNNNQPVQSSVAVAVADSNAIVYNERQQVSEMVRSAKLGTINNWNMAHLTGISDADRDVLMICRPPALTGITAPAPALTDTAVTDLFTIKGKIVSRKGQPVANKNITLISKSDNGIYATTSTDAAGKFVFPLSGYMDSTQFIIQPAGEKNNVDGNVIVLEPPVFPVFHTPAFLKKTLDIPATTRTAYIRRYADTTAGGNNGWLKPVSVVSRTYYDHSRRLSTATAVLNSEQLMRLGSGNIGIGLLRMPGVQLTNGFVSMYGPDQMGGANAHSEPMVLWDGIEVSLSSAQGASNSSPVINYLNSLNPREIDFIEVIKGPEASIYGLRGGSGVIYIHSASEVHEDFVAGAGTMYKFYRQGYARPAVFPLETSGEKERRDAAPTDFRSALYWNENQLTDGKGNATFSFLTNDVPGWYKVLITGITVHGDLIYETLSFHNR